MYSDGFKVLAALKFYDKDGAIVFKMGGETNYRYLKSHMVHLEDGERVIGYKSTRTYLNRGYHKYFQLIIGRLY